MKPSVSLRRWFEGYLAALDRGDYDACADYYADNLRFHGPDGQVAGRDAWLALLRDAPIKSGERTEISSFVAAPDGSRIAAEISGISSARPADPTVQVTFAVYDIAGGKFTRIRTAHLSALSGARG
ncbi:hypothetical protein BH09PSE4_BH09PSE4_03860 [soil metagenome]